MACPCPDQMCSDICRYFITNYWNGECRCHVQNWLNENVGDHRFDKVQQDYDKLENALTKSGSAGEECTSGCCVDFGDGEICGEQQSRESCQERAPMCMWYSPCGESEDQNKRCREFKEEGNCIRQTRCEGKYGSQGFGKCKPKVY